MGAARHGLSVAVTALWFAGHAFGQTVPNAVGDGLPLPLTAIAGDAVHGEALVRSMARASCLICHQAPIPDEPDQGNIGPDLAGVGGRLTAAELRLRLVDARVVNPATVMPPYHALTDLTRVRADYAGKTIYSAQEVEDVVAWLLTLKTP